MDASPPERAIRRTVLISAVVAGVALGVLVLVGGALILFESSGLLTATTGLIATAVVALVVGLWVGGPAVDADDPPMRERWVVAGLSVAVAGVYASLLDLSQGMVSGVLAQVGGLLLLIAIPLYALGLSLPVLLGWALRRVEEHGEEADWSVPGVLILGVLGGMAIGVIASGLWLLPWAGAGPLLLGTSALLLVPLALRDPEAAPAQEKVIYEADTPFHELRVTEFVYPGERQPERRLYLNGEEESGELVRSGAPTLAYVAAAESWLAANTPRGSSYLFLGGGAYTLPRRVAERDGRARITVVELDPEVTRAAYRFFGLRPDHGVLAVHGDARAFLERAEGSHDFDRVYLDVYGGHEALPYPLVTVEAFLALRRRLRERGLAALNVIGITHGPESPRLWSVVRTFAEVFPSVAVYSHLGPDYPERQNLLLVGALEPEHEFAATAGYFDQWPRESWPIGSGTTVYRDLFVEEPGPDPRKIPSRSPDEVHPESRGERSTRS